MRIAIDATEIEGTPTGVGRCLLNLMQHWTIEPGPHEFVMVHRRELPAWIVKADNVSLYQLPEGMLKNGVWRQQVSLPRALDKIKPDLFFAPAYTIPLLWDGPTVVVVHDISYQVHPEWFTPRYGMRMRFLSRRSVEKATHVIAVSDFSRKEIIEQFSTDSTKVHTVYNAFDDSLKTRPFSPEGTLRNKMNAEGPFVLMVGSIFERRYPDQILEALQLLQDSDLKLVVVGKDMRMSGSDFHAEIVAAGLKEKVIWLEYASEADLIGLYRIADQLLYLSAYEGFGLPPLEALSFGLPVLLTKMTSLAEIYSDVAHFVKSPTPPDIATGIIELHTDMRLREKMIAKAKPLVERYNIRTMAEKTMEVLELAAGDQ